MKSSGISEMSGVAMFKIRISQIIYNNLIISLLLLTFQQNLFASTVTETFQKKIDFKNGGFLSLSNTNGDIEIRSWDKNEVEIIAYKKVKASDRETAEKLMKRLEIEFRNSDDEIIIKTNYPRSSSGEGFFGWIFGKDHASFSVEYEIKVPEEIDLNIHTTNGEVRIEKIAGRLRLESTNGKINARNINGLTRCKTTNGDIKVEFDDVPEGDKMTFRTTNGSIKIYLPENYGADDVELKTTNGSVESDFPMSGSSSRKSKKRFRGSISKGNRELSCSTMNGSIHLLVND
jgi:DUF4097 and DUF4098 domain-containing protein YvlB